MSRGRPEADGLPVGSAPAEEPADEAAERGSGATGPRCRCAKTSILLIQLRDLVPRFGLVVSQP